MPSMLVIVRINIAAYIRVDVEEEAKDGKIVALIWYTNIVKGWSMRV